MRRAKRPVLFLVAALACAAGAFPANWQATWNLGTIDTVWNHWTQIDERSFSIDDFGFSLVDLQFHEPENRYGIQASLVQFRENANEGSIAVIPLEAYFTVLDLEPFYLGLYGRAEMGFSPQGFDPFFEGGVKLFLHALEDPMHLRYSYKCSVYLGFDNKKELNIGTQIDLGIAGLFFLWASSKTSDAQN